jgi:hypothetical protein
MSPTRPGQIVVLNDLGVDTSLLVPLECAAAIEDRLGSGPPPAAFAQLSSGLEP